MQSRFLNASGDCREPSSLVRGRGVAYGPAQRALNEVANDTRLGRESRWDRLYRKNLACIRGCAGPIQRRPKEKVLGKRELRRWHEQQRPVLRRSRRCVIGYPPKRLPKEGNQGARRAFAFGAEERGQRAFPSAIRQNRRRQRGQQGDRLKRKARGRWSPAHRPMPTDRRSSPSEGAPWITGAQEVSDGCRTALSSSKRRAVSGTAKVRWSAAATQTQKT